MKRNMICMTLSIMLFLSACGGGNISSGVDAPREEPPTYRAAATAVPTESEAAATTVPPEPEAAATTVPPEPEAAAEDIADSGNGGGEAVILGEYPFELSQECAKAYLSILHGYRDGFGAPVYGGEWEDYPIWHGCCGGFLAELGGVDHEPELVLAVSEVSDGATAPYSQLLVYTWDGTKAISADQIAVLASGTGRSWPTYMLRQTVTGNILQETWHYLDGPSGQRYMGVRCTDGWAALEDVGALVSDEDDFWMLGGGDYILFQNYETLDDVLTFAASIESDEPAGSKPSD